MDRKRKISIALPVSVLLLVALLVFGEKRGTKVYQHDSGLVFGTSYNITYECS